MAPVFLTPLFVVAMFAPFFLILNEQFYDGINSYLDKIWKYPISWRPFYFEWLRYSIDGPQFGVPLLQFRISLSRSMKDPDSNIIRRGELEKRTNGSSVQYVDPI